MLTTYPGIKAAIVDYGLGNLFSVKHACKHVGLNASVTSSPEEIADADLVILPGVGAFADAMRALNSRRLSRPLREVGASQTRILFGICLGMQLLLTESSEFGRHEGLSIVEGSVCRLNERLPGEEGTVKVPQVGWNRIYDSRNHGKSWNETPLEGLLEGEYMYFVHSYHAVPKNPDVVLSVTRYGGIEFCSSLRQGNVFATQFHPERSGEKGLMIYRNLVSLVARAKEGQNI